MDTRAQSIGIARFILGLIVAAVVSWILVLTTEPILDRAQTTTGNETAHQGTQWMSQGIEWWPMFAILVSSFGLIVYAVYVREVKR